MFEQIIAYSDCECKEKDIPLVTGTGEILVDRSSTGRIRPWGDNKKMGMKILELYRLAKKSDETLIPEKRLEALEHCGDFLKFGQYADDSIKLAEAYFCQMRLCPQCNWRRSLKLYAQVSQITDAILKDKPSVRFLFVTLTVKNVKGAEIKESLDSLNQGFKALVQSKKQYKAAAGFQKSLLGYMKAVEITYNSETDTFHPHMHIIFEVKKEYFSGWYYISHEKWRSMWQSVMKLDYEPQVNIKAIKTEGESKVKAKAIAEIAKYPVKSTDVVNVKDKGKAVNALIDLHKGTFNRRFVSFGGDFKEYKRMLGLDDTEKGDLVHVETESATLNPVAYILYRWRVEAGAYIC